MNLADILHWSADLAGCAEVPADSQVYVEATGAVSRVLFGVDIEMGELLYARDAGFDAVIAHHPLGDRASLGIIRVAERQIDQMVAEGVPADAARQALERRLAGGRRAQHASNINRLIDTARLLGMPLANVHLPCDIISRGVIVDLLHRRAGTDSTVGDAVGWLGEIPEIDGGFSRPEPWVGSADNALGRWTVAMAGGINGGHPAFREYFAAGVDTIFTMHVGEEDLRLVREEAPEGKNLVVTGHMATDSIGINRVIAGLEGHGLGVTRTSGVVSP